jgi:nitric oxide synthase-interacting protein
MTRHSKNNTTAGSFTYAERQKLSYGSQTARCTKDSLRPLTHCHLCLQLARDANCCLQGHLACRSCFIEDILAQKANYKLKVADWEAAKTQNLLHFQAEEAKKKEKSVKEFISQQQNKKRCFSDSEKEVLTDQVVAVVVKNDSEITDQKQAKPKEEISCRSGSSGPHQISLKTLVPLTFHFLPDKKTAACPTCVKPLAALSKALVFPTCGHVVCETCYKSLNNQMRKCLVCDHVEPSEIISLQAEGTGFAAAGGTVEAKRFDLAFQ